MKTLTSFLVFLMFGAMCWMGGHWFAIDATNSFLKDQVSFAQPEYRTDKYYRYGGSLDDQLARIKAEGKKELVAKCDSFMVRLWPWDTVLKEWRELCQK